MIKHLLVFMVCLTLSVTGMSQSDSAAGPLKSRSGIRISLLTCGTGDQVWETFGHTALRVVDSSVGGRMGDIVYNYGMFNGYDENFELKFMRGKLLYYVATEFYGNFMEEYFSYGRKVEEQVLLLEEKDKQKIAAFLRRNTLPENRYYKYDFFFDNCATRIRDIFPDVLGSNFHFEDVRPKGVHLSFRDIINKYFYKKHWERVGVNILLGSKIDRVMTNADIMFLPDYLRDGVASASYNGKSIATEPELILDGSEQLPAGPNFPLVLTILIFFLTLIGISVPKLQVLGRVMRILVLSVTGLLGCLILIMWFGTNHQGCSQNTNILWALPLNFYIAFAKPKGIGKYSVIAMLCIVGVLIVHIAGVQAIIPEFIPLLLSLLLVHGWNYRRSTLIVSKSNT